MPRTAPRRQRTGRERKPASSRTRKGVSKPPAESRRRTYPKCKLEEPRSRRARVQAFTNAAYPTEKRILSNAYDDKVCKRYRPASDANGYPWESEANFNMHGQQLENPGYVHLEDESTCESLRAEMREMGAFRQLPVEIRLSILRILLVAPHDIRVLQGWSLVYPRSRPNLRADLLSLSKGFYRDGASILYGENTFVYVIRDPSDEHRDTNRVLDRVYHDDGFSFPIERHGALIRNIKLVLEKNRMREWDERKKFFEALEKFLPDGEAPIPAQLRTITVQLPAMTAQGLNVQGRASMRTEAVPVAEWLRSKGSILRYLATLNCQFIRIIAVDHSGDQYEAIVDRRPHFTQIYVQAGNQDNWFGDGVMLTNRKRDVSKSQARLQTLHYWIEFLVRDPLEAMRLGCPFRLFFPEESATRLEALPSGASHASSTSAFTYHSSTTRTSAQKARHHLSERFLELDGDDDYHRAVEPIHNEEDHDYIDDDEDDLFVRG